MANGVQRMAHELIDAYFGHRAEKLEQINLEELLASANPHALCLHRVGQADELVESLLQETMRPFDEAALGEVLAGLRTQVSFDSDMVLIQLVRDYTGVQYIVHGTTLGRAMNRLCLSFLNRFSLADGSIDWKKLVRFAPHAGEQEKGEVPNGVRGG